MDDKQSLNIQPISDDQELAKVLAGVTNEFKIEEPLAKDDPIDKKNGEDKQPNPSTNDNPAQATTSESPDNADKNEPPVINSKPIIPVDFQASNTVPAAANSNDTNNLEGIKKEALVELRPILDRLELSPEEKFDICLLLLRSTDDKTLIAPAHDAAKKITDEAKRAQALLDVIKEIDYLSNPSQPSAL